jgi:hypothetical protein
MGTSGGWNAAAFAAAALALALGACTTGQGKTPVEGRVTQSPGCGVVRVDEPPCPNPPVAGEVQVKAADGAVVARAHTNASGRYQVAVAPGAYTVVVDPDGDAVWPHCPDTPLVVAGRPVRSDVICGSGIR